MDHGELIQVQRVLALRAWEAGGRQPRSARLGGGASAPAPAHPLRPRLGELGLVDRLVVGADDHEQAAASRHRLWVAVAQLADDKEEESRAGSSTPKERIYEEERS